MDSPISRLLPRIEKTIHTTLPNAANGLILHAYKAKLNTIVTDSTEFHFRINAVTQVITLPLAALEHLWFTCYTSTLIFEYCDILRTKGDIEHCLYEQEDIVQSLVRLQQTRDQLSGQSTVNWQNISSYLNEVPIEANADRLFIHSLENLILPAFLHFLKGFADIQSSDIDHAYQREITSAKLLINLSTNHQDKMKRGMAWIIASLLKSSQNLLCGNANKDLSIDSFAIVLTQIPMYFEKENHPIYIFLRILFHAHFNHSIPLTLPSGLSWKENLFNELQEHKKTPLLFAQHVSRQRSAMLR